MTSPNVTQRTETHPPSELDRLERWARILSLAAIPVALGIASFVLDATFKDRSIDRDYVNIALKILRSPKPEEANEPDRLMRSWAMSLLQDRSPVPLPIGLSEAILEGEVLLPTSIGQARPFSKEGISFLSDLLEVADNTIELARRALLEPQDINSNGDSRKILNNLVLDLEAQRGKIVNGMISMGRNVWSFPSAPTDLNRKLAKNLLRETQNFVVGDPFQTIDLAKRFHAHLAKLLSYSPEIGQ